MGTLHKFPSTREESEKNIMSLHGYFVRQTLRKDIIRIGMYGGRLHHPCNRENEILS